MRLRRRDGTVCVFLGGFVALLYGPNKLQWSLRSTQNQRQTVHATTQRAESAQRDMRGAQLNAVQRTARDLDRFSVRLMASFDLYNTTQSARNDPYVYHMDQDRASAHQVCTKLYRGSC